MSRFGEIIDVQEPVLIFFHSWWDIDCRNMRPIIKELKIHFGIYVKIIKIDIDNNKMLFNMLKIKTLPTLMIYKDGQQKWKEPGKWSFDEICEILKEYL